MCLECIRKASGICLESIRKVRCLLYVSKVSGMCVEGIWKVSKSVWKVSGGCLGCLLKVSWRCLEKLYDFFEKCVAGANKMSRTRLRCVWKVSGMCLANVLKDSGMSLDGAWKFFKVLEGVGMSLKSFQKKFGRFLKCFWRVSEGVDMRSGWFKEGSGGYKDSVLKASQE